MILVREGYEPAAAQKVIAEFAEELEPRRPHELDERGISEADLGRLRAQLSS